MATSIFSFITAWNELIFALVLMSGSEGYTMPVAMQYFFGQKGTDWCALASSTMMTIPVVVFFLLVQRRMVSVVVAGAVKG